MIRHVCIIAAVLQQRCASLAPKTVERRSALAALASSPRFSKYGDDRLKADAWYEVAQREGQYLSKHAKFEAVVEEVAAAMPGVKEAIRQRQEAQGAVLV